MTANPFHPELRRLARFIPPISFNPLLLKVARWSQRRAKTPLPDVDGVTIEDIFISADDGDRTIRLRVYRPISDGRARPAMVWMHGGGYIIGAPEQDEANNAALCRRLDMVIVAVAYRLSPEAPFPAPLEDCYSALEWLHASAGRLNVDPVRIAVGGPSAGAGLAAGLALLARDRGALPIAFQLLIYPMIDDRTVLRRDIDRRRLRLWTQKSNRFGWRCYLGQLPGAAAISSHAAPARAHDLAGLPAAWVGVGTCDLFHDESVAYARRLRAAGVLCELVEVPGAFHGFDAVAKNTDVACAFREAYIAALVAGLKIDHDAASEADARRR